MLFLLLLLCFGLGILASGFERIVILGFDIWSCLCWVDVLFLGFYSLWFLRKCDGCVLPSRKFFWDPDICGHWRFWVKCVSWCWKLTIRNWVCLEESCSVGLEKGRKQNIPILSAYFSRNGDRKGGKTTTL